MIQLAFPDKVVTYDIFIRDISARVAALIESDKDDPETVSQRKAYQIFGRGNVDRWNRQGRLSSCKRPGKVEYKMAELRLLQRTEQDYFK